MWATQQPQLVVGGSIELFKLCPANNCALVLSSFEGLEKLRDFPKNIGDSFVWLSIFKLHEFMLPF